MKPIEHEPGGYSPQPDVAHSVEEAQPPLAWYVAVGTNDRGILLVLYSDEFLAREDGEMNRRLGDWHHFGLMLNARKPSERDPEMVERVERAAEYIQRATGFSPEQLAARKLELSQALWYKHEAPIELILVD